MALVGFVCLSLLVGVSSGAIAALGVRTWYLTLLRPPATPPTWLFAPVWAALYVVIGVAAWLVYRQVDRAVMRTFRALRLWGWQLLLNACLVPSFFGLQSPALAVVVCILLLATVLLTVRAFARIDRRAALLLMPYVAWTVFMCYLAAGFWWVNDA